MSNVYKSITTPVLQKMWEREKARLEAKADAVISDYDDLLAMRRELDRRRGYGNPPASVDFSKEYTTD